MQIETIKSLKTGDEVLIKYSESFFEEKECRCATCLSTHEQPAKISEKNTICHEVEYINQITTDCLILQFESLISELIRDLSMEIMIDITKVGNSCPGGSKKRKIPLKLSEKWAYFESEQLQSLQTPLGTEKSDAETESFWDNIEKTSADANYEFSKRQTSSPVSANLKFSLPCFSLSSLTTAEVEDFVSDSPEAFTPVSLRINPYSEVGLHNTILAMKAFCLRNNLSDRGASDLHSLFDAFLSENCFPSNFAFMKDLKRSFQLNTRIAVETPGGYLCVMSFGYDIAQIVRRNWQTMVTYSNQRHSKFKHLDFSINKIPPIDLVQPLITINLVLSTDGVCVSDSSTESELWPVWLAIAHLPPKLRFSRKNICLASLFCGNKKPPWRTVVNHLKAELDQVFVIENHKVQFRCVTIVADIPAKANVLSMYKNNGYNGCNLCTADGKTIGKSHSYYPFEQENKSLNIVHQN